MSINVAKTILLINKLGLKAEGISIGESVDIGGMQFEVVAEFKYLGLSFDSKGGEKLMI